jgi:predicted HTH domain antitoxin
VKRWLRKSLLAWDCLVTLQEKEIKTMAQTVQLNLRIDAELARHLNRIAEQESLRKTDVARKYLVEGVREWRLEQAIRHYQQKQVSLERAAADAGLTLYEMMDELRRRGTALDQTTPAEARAEIRALLEEIAAAPN